MGYQRQKLEDLANMPSITNALNTYLEGMIEPTPLSHYLNRIVYATQGSITPNYDDLANDLFVDEFNSYTNHLHSFYDFCLRNDKHLLLPSDMFYFEDENSIICVENKFNEEDNYIFTYFDYNHDTGDRRLLVFEGQINNYDVESRRVDIDLNVLHYSVYDNSDSEISGECSDSEIIHDIESITYEVPREAFEKAAYIYKLGGHYKK